MSNKDFLWLDNEYRNEVPKNKPKPKITLVEKPLDLTKRVADFLSSSGSKNEPKVSNEESSSDVAKAKPQVEMDIYITPITDTGR